MTRPLERELIDAVLELSANAIVLVDERGRIALWNAAAESVLGWPAEEALGQEVLTAMVAPTSHSTARDLLAKLAVNGTWEGAVPLRHRDGHAVVCAVRARALAGDGGNSGAGNGNSGGGNDSAHGAVGEVLAVFAELGRSGPDGPNGPDGPDPAGTVRGDDRAALLRAERAALLRAERTARAELEHVRDRLAYVVHASSRLASSLDVGMTMETVGDLVVPRFGTLCIIDLWDGRRLDRVYVRASEPARQALVERIRGLGGSQRDGHPAMRAVFTGRPAVLSTADPDALAQMYADPGAHAVVQEATRGSGFVAVPLVTRGRVIGVLTLLGPGHAYGRDLAPGEDLAVLEQVATRAAQSIENARLFDAERRLARNLADSERRQRRTALTLQRSLLPAWINPPRELEVATRYFPGAEEAEVGGDWYDVIPLGPARTALVIGDVMGRGLRAATFMGQVRTAVRAYARQDLRPKEILALLDGVVADLGDTEIVTCAYAVFDAARGTLTYASAGHLPLLTVDGNGKARRLDHEAGLPLGVGASSAAPARTAPEHVVALPVETTVAFYTDGLVENRRRDVDAGIDALVDALARASGSLEGLCDQVIDALRPPGGYDDDVALLLARSLPRG
ncbi:PAS domain S-box-containing protein [Actinopolymorpha cephalotaxi]|uniref:protein-serine/threonine phosphatase n=1 Tax=Actinopolymorpha cephalotaxi TaxID=504797 RepID=A0A1I3B3L0_9ACTN|nr:SpoIIE family protein phosphatase [Actinopolymorpha cephalotaxi]NYH81214.1 PAS domain S-box-containing protein [Actinopolymorpha cephalotaxi]SFH56676.1 PAS domain S-box-containing protein [Actinopolymorpha cephalotaxi]